MGLLDSITGLLGGQGSTTQTSTTGVHKMGKQEKSQYLEWVDQFNNLLENLQGLQSTKEGAFKDYRSALGQYGGEYQGALKTLMDSISSGKNDLSFSLGGGNTASFTPQNVRANASIMGDLAKNLYTSQMAEPTAAYQFKGDNNKYATNLDYYNLISNLAQQIQNRRYGVTQTTTEAKDTSQAGINDVLEAVSGTIGGLKGLGEVAAGSGKQATDNLGQGASWLTMLGL